MLMPALRREQEHRVSVHVYRQEQQVRRSAMPAIWIPVLWVGGTALLLGGGYWVIHTIH
jgi:hypothetical protein